MSSGKQSSTVPMTLQKPCNLLPMMYFTYTNWQLGDRPFLPLGFDAKDLASGVGAEGAKSYDNFFKQAEQESPVGFENTQGQNSLETIPDSELIIDSLTVHKQKTSKKLRKATKKEKKYIKRKERHAEYAALIVKTKTSVDILWQDGTRSCQLKASSLIPVEYLGDHEFCPEQYVLGRGFDGEGLDNEESHVGNKPSFFVYLRASM